MDRIERKYLLPTSISYNEEVKGIYSPFSYKRTPKPDFKQNIKTKDNNYASGAHWAPSSCAKMPFTKGVDADISKQKTFGQMADKSKRAHIIILQLLTESFNP